MRKSQSEQQLAELLEQRRLPRGQNEYLLPRVHELPRVRRSPQESQEHWADQDRCQREWGLLKLQETLRQVCQCVRVCQRGWQWDTEDCRLEDAVWITSRGVGELPWIAGGLEHVRGIDVPQSRDGLDIAMENLKDLCRVLDGAARREPQGKRTQWENREKTTSWHAPDTSELLLRSLLLYFVLLLMHQSKHSDFSFKILKNSFTSLSECIHTCLLPYKIPHQNQRL